MTSAGPRAGRRLPRAAALGAPLGALLLVVLVWPLVTMALRSVSAPDGGVHLGRYVEVLTSGRYAESLVFTAVLALASTVLALVICVPAGLYLERDRTRTGRGLAVAMTVPLSLPGIVIGFFIILTVGNTGVVPTLTEAVTGERMLQISYTWAGLLLGYLYFQIPRVVLVVRGAAGAVRPEAVDVARSLGASTATVYRRVVLPALRPAIASSAALALATAFGAFGTAATLSRGIRVVPLEVASAFTDAFQPELAATLSVLLAVLTTVILVGVGRLGEARVQGRPA
ncbi:ABC transporter permease subunit [Cellulomonas sp. APG4]|uniref:ABC transporter permease n=1 Tax=Cellulomonas sp. APG4 TaxID=1538656 RepID=UPI0013799DD0|nr:ABC transporter permease subunit [Cellulomonas sp. APG4]NCT91010.1 ABC transporter permease subunit [Cellulomonas sp. APG4]